MRKDELAKAIRFAIEVSDEVYAKHPEETKTERGKYCRIDGFVHSLSLSLKDSDPKLAEELTAYRQRVSEGK